MDETRDSTRPFDADADAHATRTADHSPTVLPPPSDGFDLLEEIGRGGMGLVYRAIDRHLNREVAVKLLQCQLPPDSPAVRRFVREVQITAQLQHPGIPAVYQTGVWADGRPFLAMKLIRGKTLDQLLKENEGVNAPAVFEAICQAVGYAHAAGFIHRDLKPQNVMVGAFGEVQVMDWGLARRADEPATDGEADANATLEWSGGADGAAATQLGAVLGTPAYMSPEQASGGKRPLTPRADVFGLGGILCVLITGRPPFVGSTTEAVRAAAAGDLVETHSRLDACHADPELVALCKRCLSPEPADRPASANEVAEAVADLRRRADERAKKAEQERVAAVAREGEQRRRRRVQTVLAAVVGLFVIAGGLVAWWATGQEAERQRQRAATVERAERTANEAVERAISLRKQFRWDEALAELDSALVGDLTNTPEESVERVRTTRKETAALHALDQKLYGALGVLQRPEDLNPEFAELGVTFAPVDAGRLAEEVRRSPVQAELVATLDLTAIQFWGWTNVRPPIDDALARATGQGWRKVLADRDRKSGTPEAVRRADELLTTRGDPAEYLRLPDALPSPQAQALLLRAGTAFYPSDWRLQLRALHYAQGAKDLPAQLAAAQTLASQRPNVESSWRRLFPVMSANGLAEAADATVVSLLADHPDWVMLGVTSAAALIERKQFPRAMARLESLIALAPTEGAVQNQLLYLGQQGGDTDWCLRQLNRLVEIATDSDPEAARAADNNRRLARPAPTGSNASPARKYRAQLHWLRGDRDAALKDVAHLLATDPTNLFYQNLQRKWARGPDQVSPADLMTRARALGNRSAKYVDAVRLVRQAVENDPTLAAWPNDPPGYYAAACVGQIMAGRGDAATASPDERVEFRRLALSWLWQLLHFVRSEPVNSQYSAGRKDQFQVLFTDAWIATLRSATWMNTLPIDEKAEWEKLWAEARRMKQAFDAGKPFPPYHEVLPPPRPAAER